VRVRVTALLVHVFDSAIGGGAKLDGAEVSVVVTEISDI
jgi:hypothetical protein